MCFCHVNIYVILLDWFVKITVNQFVVNLCSWKLIIKIYIRPTLTILWLIFIIKKKNTNTLIIIIFGGATYLCFKGQEAHWKGEAVRNLFSLVLVVVGRGTLFSWWLIGRIPYVFSFLHFSKSHHLISSHPPPQRHHHFSLQSLISGI